MKRLPQSNTAPSTKEMLRTVIDWIATHTGRLFIANLVGQCIVIGLIIAIYGKEVMEQPLYSRSGWPFVYAMQLSILCVPIMLKNDLAKAQIDCQSPSYLKAAILRIWLNASIILIILVVIIEVINNAASANGIQSFHCWLIEAATWLPGAITAIKWLIDIPAIMVVSIAWGKYNGLVDELSKR